METINCPICKTKDFKDYISVGDRFNEHEDNQFNIVKCNCGLIFLNPRPTEDEISQYYENAEYDPHRNKGNSLKDVLYSLVQQVALRFKHFVIILHHQSGNLLDIGGGKGEFAEFMSIKGFDTTLQDNYSNYNGNIEFYNNLNEIEAKFDIITMWHVLEHIHELDKIFEFLNDKLNKNGILVLAVPNHNAVERKYFKEKWAPYDAPRHLYHFDDDSLTKLLNKHNFKIVRKNTLVHDSFYNILLSFKSLDFIKFIKSIIIGLNCFIYTFFFGTKKSSTIMVTCEKF